tara:strand:+ start:272 stop:964 length:693 start_codon:yes stop_codon:yes gene_type:complete
MKISKYLHSCILIEHEGERLLFDPGKFTFAEELVKPSDFKDLNYVLITHTHPDHLDEENLKLILEKNPDAKVIGNSEVRDQLAKISIPVILFEKGSDAFGSFELIAIPTEHEDILAENIPQHTSICINDSILNTADSLSDKLMEFKNIELLIMPIMGPFLTELEAFRFVKELSPKQLLGVHDGYAKSFFLDSRYETWGKFLRKENIQFYGFKKPGETLNISSGQHSKSNS